MSYFSSGAMIGAILFVAGVATALGVLITMRLSQISRQSDEQRINDRLEVYTE